KAATDRASQLGTEAAGLRKSLAAAPLAPSNNALSNALGRVLSIPALTAATIQQGFVSAIVELLIAAVLALPELLRSSRAKEPAEARQGRDLETVEVLPPTTLETVPRALPKLTGVQEAADEHAVDPKPVIAFLAQHMPVARGGRADWSDVYCGFREWQ